MPRVTASQVTKTFNTDLSTEAVEAWIKSANLDVDEIATRDPTLSTARLEEIELRLAQAKATAQDPRIDSGGRETASVNYADSNADYWQLAKGADPTGYLSSYGKPKASVGVPEIKDLG